MPSQILGEKNKLSAWMLDKAITYFGITFNNALQERIQTGEGKSIPRYTLAELMNEKKRLPREGVASMSDIGSLIGAAGAFFDEVKK